MTKAAVWPNSFLETAFEPRAEGGPRQSTRQLPLSHLQHRTNLPPSPAFARSGSCIWALSAVKLTVGARRFQDVLRLRFVQSRVCFEGSRVLKVIAMTVFSRYRALLRLSLVCVTAGFTPPLAVQIDAVQNGEQLYKEATEARTVDEYNVVLEKIDKLVTNSDSQALSEYLSKLQAWVLNRRGERYTEQASQALQAGDRDLAKKLDAAALEDYELSIQLDETRWKSLHNRGVSYALAGRTEDAVKDFTQVIQLRRDYVNAWFNRGELNYELGRFREAVADYTGAIRLQADDADFHTSRGHAYFQLRQFKQAWEDYNRAVQLSPDDAVALADRGEAYRSMGQWEAAANDFRTAIELDPQMARAYQSAAWLMATCPDKRYRNPELAVKAAETAVELQGDDDYIYLDTLAAAYANDGQFDKARSTVRRAIALTPSDYAGRLEMRLNLYRQQKAYRQTLGPPKAVSSRREPPGRQDRRPACGSRPHLEHVGAASALLACMLPAGPLTTATNHATSGRRSPGRDW